MKQRVALVEFSIFDQFPLISGYLHAYATIDPAIAATFEFIYYQKEVGRVDYTDTLRAIRALNARIVCFSVYVWNIGLVRRLVADLQVDRNIEHIILGGHQISHQIATYIDRRDHKTIVINGQGEIAFRDTLRSLATSSRLEPLAGISFFRDGDLCNGGEAAMLARLDDIPSPFLNGHFDDMLYPTAVIETNRGCPYQCTFCTWGGDTMRVAKFDLDRVKAELLWLAKRSVPFLYLADANWGMLPRDIEISEYIARLKQDFGSPWGVYYAATKNKPRGSIACIEKFYAGGVITSQALGIQSMNPTTLSLVKRENIKTSAFIEMFAELARRKIDSYCELIWPLPGETLESLQQGFESLLEIGARTIILYPAVLINNSKLKEQAAEFEMESVYGDDWMSELKIVKATKFAPRNAVESGFWFYYSYFLLGNCDFHKALLRYLHTSTEKSYADIVTAFADELRGNAMTSAYAQTLMDIFKQEAHGTLVTIGRLATHLGHEQRFAAIADVARFIVKYGVADNLQRDLALLGLWALSFPKLFADTPDEIEALIGLLDQLGSPHGVPFSNLARVHSSEQGIHLEVDDFAGIWTEVVRYFGIEGQQRISRIDVRHPTTSFIPYEPGNPIRNFQYSHGMIERMGQLVPDIRVLPGVVK